jgi:hypothetical protein
VGIRAECASGANLGTPMYQPVTCKQCGALYATMDDLESLVMDRRYGTTRQVCRVCSRPDGTFVDARPSCIDCGVSIPTTVNLASAADVETRSLDVTRIRCDPCRLLAEAVTRDGDRPIPRP